MRSIIVARSNVAGCKHCSQG